MSSKRGAGSDLNHDNWDDEDDVEEVGEFKKASTEELKRRTIKVAKRRGKIGCGSDSTDIAGDKLASSSVFSGFGGFGKIDSKPSSSPFSFLSAGSTPFSAAPAATKSNTPITDKGMNGGANKLMPPVTQFASTSAWPSAPTVDKAPAYAKLKGLNQSVSAWIVKKIAENPLCILTPIFDDYSKYLKEIENSTNTTTMTTTVAKSATDNIDDNAAVAVANKAGNFSFSSSASSSFAIATTPTSSAAAFTIPPATTTSSFCFGLSSAAKPSDAAAAATKPSISLFGAAPSTSSSTGFSFGGALSTPFTFAHVKKPDDTAGSSSSAGPSSSAGATADEETDEPPKNEFTAVVEEDSLYSKRCKVFVKVAGEYVERGVGMMYIKSVEDGAKTQLLVRADTNLGNVLLNIRLSEGVPANRMGKNNVMLMCIPTPDSKPPPCAVLVRVKTSDEADELLDHINKHKK